MKILLHAPSLFTGGAERQLMYLAKGLADRSHVVHVVTFYHGGKFWDELSKDSRITLYCLYRKGKWDFFIAYRLLRYCKFNNIDIIQAFLEPSSVIASLAAKLQNIPLVIGIRSSNMKLAFGSHMYKLAERFIGNRLAKKYVCNSYSGKQYNSSIGYRRSIMDVIANGLLMPKRDFRLPFNCASCVSLGVVARLDPMKDIPTMLQAYSIILHERDDVRLLIYGDGEDLYKQELIKICKNLQIEEKVSWRGWSSSVWQAYDEIDILVSSSSSGEGMSNTLMEAMATGRVIVATDVGDARRLVEGKTEKMGYIVPSGAAEMLAETILYAIENQQESLKYAESAKINIEQDYSVEAMVSAYDKLYRNILN